MYHTVDIFLKLCTMSTFYSYIYVFQSVLFERIIFNNYMFDLYFQLIGLIISGILVKNILIAKSQSPIVSASNASFENFSLLHR